VFIGDKWKTLMTYHDSALMLSYLHLLKKNQLFIIFARFIKETIELLNKMLLLHIEELELPGHDFTIS